MFLNVKFSIMYNVCTLSVRIEELKLGPKTKIICKMLGEKIHTVKTKGSLFSFVSYRN